MDHGTEIKVSYQRGVQKSKRDAKREKNPPRRNVGKPDSDKVNTGVVANGALSSTLPNADGDAVVDGLVSQSTPLCAGPSKNGVNINNSTI